MHLGIIIINNQLDAQFLLYIYFDSLHVSSNLVLIIRRGNCINTTSGICHSPSGMQARYFLPDLHTGPSPTQRDIYQILYWYNWLSWWWAQGWSKHVANRNKYIKGIVRQVGYLWLLTYTSNYLEKSCSILHVLYRDDGGGLRTVRCNICAPSTLCCTTNTVRPTALWGSGERTRDVKSVRIAAFPLLFTWQTERSPLTPRDTAAKVPGFCSTYHKYVLCLSLSLCGEQKCLSAICPTVFRGNTEM